MGSFKQRLQTEHFYKTDMKTFNSFTVVVDFLLIYNSICYNPVAYMVIFSSILNSSPRFISGIAVFVNRMGPNAQPWRIHPVGLIFIVYEDRGEWRQHSLCIC